MYATCSYMYMYYHKAQRYTLYNLLLHIDYTVAEHSKAKKMEIANLQKTTVPRSYS